MENNKKMIYVVTKGCYSDYCIYGVFDNKEIATLFSDKINGNIEDYELNPIGLDIRNKNMYFVRMDKKGNVEECYLDVSSGVYGFDCNNSLMTNCWAINEQHAIKIINELRISLIVENLWK